MKVQSNHKDSFFQSHEPGDQAASTKETMTRSKIKLKSKFDAKGSGDRTTEFLIEKLKSKIKSQKKTVLEPDN